MLDCDLQIEPARVVREYGDLVDALIQRRKSLGFSQLELDDRSGLQVGYTGKIECWKNRKHGRGLSIVSLPLVLEALGLGLIVVRVRKIARKLETEPRQLFLDLGKGIGRRETLNLDVLRRYSGEQTQHRNRSTAAQVLLPSNQI